MIDDDPLAVFERIARDALSDIGYGLFTATAFDPETMQVQRVYSSNPSAYPVGGRKPKRDTEFGQHVLIEGKPLVCEGDAAIARTFDDHETIHALGLHSSINVPVIGELGSVVGVLNFLLQDDGVTSNQLQAVNGFARETALVAALSGNLG